MSAKPPDEEPPPAEEEGYGAPIPEGMMVTPAGLVACVPEETSRGKTGKANGELNVAAPVKGAELLLRDTNVDASRLQGYEPAARDWVVRYRIPRAEVTLFSGSGGLGKSTIAIQLQIAMAGGVDWLGYECLQGRSVGFYCEESLDEGVRRMKAVRHRLGVSWEDMERVSFHSLKGQEMYLVEIDRYTSWVEPTDLLYAMQMEVEKLDAKLLILDSLNRLFPGNENNRVETTGFLRMLERLAVESDVAVLLISHPSKSGETDGSFYSGSTAWHSMVRSRVFLTTQRIDPEIASPEDLENPLLILGWGKANYAAKGRDLELERSLDPDNPLDTPPIYVAVTQDQKDGETRFLDIIDLLHQAQTYPRPISTGSAKMMFAPVMVYKHNTNRKSGRTGLTMEQCLNLYTKLMSQGRLCLVEILDEQRKPKQVVAVTQQEEIKF